MTSNAVVDLIDGGTTVETNGDKVVITGAISIGSSATLARATNVESLTAATQSASGLAHSIVIPTDVKLSNFTKIDLSGDTHASSTGVVTLTGVTGNETIYGVGAGNNTLTGGSGNDTILGGSIADTLVGAAGNDVYVFANSANAADVVTEITGEGTDTIYVFADANLSLLKVGAGPTTGATLKTVGFIDQVLIKSGATGTFAGTQLTGETVAVNADATGAAHLAITVADTAVNTFSSLTFTTVSGMDPFDTGTDTVAITIGAGGVGANVTGTTLADSITGNSGADTISGGTGADSLTGGAGADSLTGGAGADIFRFASGSGNTTTTIDEIVDLLTGGADTIKTGTAASGANYVELTAQDYGKTVALSEIVTAAETEFDGMAGGATQYVIADNGSSDAADEGTTGITPVAATFSYLIIDWNGDGTADQVIKLTGLTDLTLVSTATIVA
ncbi:MAG: hypothetical protein D0531_00210 [Methylococcales bacterium]|nr:MAG: hypothetical protein D0531_00210 [Methylococcales bacterium]